MLFSNKLKVLSAVFLGTLTFSVLAQDKPNMVSVSNPRLHIVDNHDTVILTNKSDKKKAFKYELYKWTQESARLENDKIIPVKNIYEVSDSLVVSPRNFVLLPNSKRGIRVSLKNKQKPEWDSYRLVLKEFTLQENKDEKEKDLMLDLANGSNNGTKVQFLSNFILPVFVPNENHIKKIEDMNISFSFVKYEGGKTALKVTNNDTQSIRLSSISLSNNNEQEFIHHILKGVTSIIPLPDEYVGKNFTVYSNHGKKILTQ